MKQHKDIKIGISLIAGIMAGIIFGVIVGSTLGGFGLGFPVGIGTGLIFALSFGIAIEAANRPGTDFLSPFAQRALYCLMGITILAVIATFFLLLFSW